MAKRKRDYLFIGSFLLLMALFTWLDLPLSKALFNQQSRFGKVFEAFGEVPCMLVASFSCAALLASVSIKHEALHTLATIGLGLLSLFFGLGAVMLPSQYIAAMPDYAMIFGFLMVFVFIMLSMRIAKTERDALREAAIVGIMMVLIALIGVNLLKAVWGRPRMRMMTDPDAEFVFWFMPKPFAQSNEYMSFPSGHTANAATIMWLTLLPTFLPRLRTKTWQTILTMICAAWIGMVMVSRVIMGAHFFTDVIFGLGITLLSFTLLCRAFITAPQTNIAALEV